MKSTLASLKRLFGHNIDDRHYRRQRRRTAARHTMLTVEGLERRLCLSGIGFTTPPGSPFPAGDYPRSVAVADFNLDGQLDVVTANELGHDVSVLDGNGDGSLSAANHFPLFVMSSQPYSVAVGDFNRDSFPDLAAAEFGIPVVSVLLNDGNGNLAFTNSYFTFGDGPNSVGVGVINGDAFLDLVATNSKTNNVSVLYGNGNGGFADATTFGVDGSPVSLVVDDFNLDGASDVATVNASNNVTVLMNDGDSLAPTAASPFPVGSGPVSLAVGDVNGDDLPDLVTANAASRDVSVLLGDGAGGFASAGNVAAGNADPRSVAAEDFNGDGRLDLAVGISSGIVTVLQGDGCGGFGEAMGFVVGPDAEPLSLAVGDFNGDDFPDLVTANGIDNSVSVLLNAVSVSVGDVTVVEGDSGTTDALFDIEFSRELTEPLTLNIATNSGTATADMDFEATSGSITFLPGTSTFRLATRVIGDTLPEDDETFFLELLGSIGGSIADGRGQATIVDDDLTISIDDVTVSEGGLLGVTQAIFTVSLNRAWSEAVSVQFSTADGTAANSDGGLLGSLLNPRDYDSATGVLTIQPGQTTATITVDVRGDLFSEEDETFFVNLATASFGKILDDQGQGTILNDDALLELLGRSGARSVAALSQTFAKGGLCSAVEPQPRPASDGR